MSTYVEVRTYARQEQIIHDRLRDIELEYWKAQTVFLMDTLNTIHNGVKTGEKVTLVAGRQIVHFKEIADSGGREKADL